MDEMKDANDVDILADDLQTAAKAPSDVVLGALVALDADGYPIVVFPGNPQKTGIVSRSTVPLSHNDIGCEVALLFENGDWDKPLVIGRIHQPEKAETSTSTEIGDSSLIVDGEKINLEAKHEIVLKCGKASITLTKAGKILIRGTYLLSRSSGANRIKGGSIQLN